MAVSTIKVNAAGWVKGTLAPGLTEYYNSAKGLCCLCFDGYNVSSTSVGNAGTAPKQPVDTIYNVITRSGSDMGVLRITTDKKMSIMATNLGSYVTGDIYGTVIYPV